MVHLMCGTRRPWIVRAKYVTALLTVALAGCSTAPAATSPATSSPSAPSISTSPDPASSNAGFDVKSLGVSFTLPASFRASDDPTLAFLARSTNPRAVFSIDHDSANVTKYNPRPGESIATADLAGVHNVVVIHSAMSGLPAGIDANELLVSNGQGSFSVIMSAPAPELPAMWQAFITSIKVTAS